MTPKGFLWILVGVLGLAIIYLKRRLIFEILNEKIAFQRKYNQIHREAYQEEKLKQAKIQGILKAKMPGIVFCVSL